MHASAAVAVFVEWWVVYCVCGIIDITVRDGKLKFPL